jgi:hypothetical protein
MRYSPLGTRGLAVIAVFLFAAGSLAAAQNEVELHRFRLGSDGAIPTGILIADAQQNLYGVTEGGGGGYCQYRGKPSGCGTAFELTQLPGGRWREKVLYAFQGGNDGAFPDGGLVFDSAGNLYGTTEGGGGSTNCSVESDPGCGTVFELSPPAQQGGDWSETIIYRFITQFDGYFPNGPLVFDQKGDLYGTTSRGSNFNYGFVFELSPPVPGGNWTETILHTFGSSGDGEFPMAGVVLDEFGNLYGTTYGGGNAAQECAFGGCGTVFELSAGDWTETLLYKFKGGSDGKAPNGTLLLAHGVILGTTMQGGGTNCIESFGCGIVFLLGPPTLPTGAWTEEILHAFASGSDGAIPASALVLDSALNVYGTTAEGGGSTNCVDSYADGCGTVFQLAPPSSPGGTWSETILHSFQGDDGALPSGLLLKEGWLLGPAAQGAGGPCIVPNYIEGCGDVFAVPK